MNAMGHQVPTMIGVDQRAAPEKLAPLVPGFMPMGSSGMGEMTTMGAMMALPENTLPMMGGAGPYGAIGMGGMFSVVKVRDGLAADDYRDPGWYRPPPGTAAAEVSIADAPPASAAASPSAPTAAPPLQVQKPTSMDRMHHRE